MIRLHLATLALVPLLACSNHVVPINITVLTQACGGAANPTDSVDHYKAVVTASDLDPISVTFEAGAPVQLEQIPPGQDRVLTLTGYEGDPDNGGTALAFGQSVPFVVPTNADSPVNATVVLRRVNTFAYPSTVADPTVCAHLTVPRAGHTATLMNDGRVLIAGGFSVRTGTVADPSDPNNWVFHDEAEIFDPATNDVEPVAKMVAFNNPNFPSGHDGAEAFGAASLMPDGTVLISGGEQYGTGFSARSNTLLYDPAQDTWTEGSMSIPDGTGGDRILDRSHHIQITGPDGGILIAGGIHYDPSTRNPTLVPEAIWLDPQTGQFHEVVRSDGSPFALPRTNASATTVLGGTAIAVGGGDYLDGGLADPPLSFFDMEDSVGALAAVGGLDATFADPLRTHGALTWLGPEQAMLVFAGGVGAGNSLLSSTAIVDSTSRDTQLSISPITARIDACAVTLPDGRALVIGGEVQGSTSNAADLYQESFYSDLGVDNGIHHSDAGAEANPFSAPYSAPSLIDSRKWHTCTVLKDGSVLVTGGVKEEGGQFQVLDSIELYTPVPL